jgi:hypothetical protein
MSFLTEDVESETKINSEPKPAFKVPWKVVRAVAITLITGIILAVTYNNCIMCVLGILIFSTLTINCLPGMPLVFFGSIAVLLYHAIDFQKSSVRVEVPLQDIVHVPTWQDMQQYVRVEANAHQRRRAF